MTAALSFVRLGSSVRTAAIALGVVLLIVVVSACGGSSDEPPRTVHPESTTGTPVIMTPTPEPRGVIEGSLAYPASGIPPDLYVCAANIITSDEFCTQEQIPGDRFLYKLGYQVEVPAGSYRVYATKPGLPPLAYYTDFVTCGSGPECRTHEVQTVTVAPGARVTDIDPTDFYGDSWRTVTP